MSQLQRDSRSRCKRRILIISLIICLENMNVAYCVIGASGFQEGSDTYVPMRPLLCRVGYLIQHSLRATTRTKSRVDCETLYLLLATIAFKGETYDLHRNVFFGCSTDISQSTVLVSYCMTYVISRTGTIFARHLQEIEFSPWFSSHAILPQETHKKIHQSQAFLISRHLAWIYVRRQSNFRLAIIAALIPDVLCTSSRLLNI